MNIEFRKYDKNNAFQNGISLSSQPCVFTNSAKASEMRGVMSCGHSVECMNLYSYFYHSVVHDRFEIRCPALLSDDPKHICNKKWTYDELRRMCLLTPQDTDFFEMALNVNRINSEGNVKPCPKCKNYVRRNDNSPWVFCQSCNIIDPNNSYYCFDCGLERPEKLKKGESTFVCSSDQCKIGEDLNFEIPKKKICGVWTGSFKKCPYCRIWIEHVGSSYCKTLTCACKYRFCFLCGKGGNVNNFDDCSTVEGGCGRPEELSELVPLPPKRERPLPQFITADDEVSRSSRPVVVSRRADKVNDPKVEVPEKKGRQPVNRPQGKTTITVSSDKEIARDPTILKQMSDDEGK